MKEYRAQKQARTLMGIVCDKTSIAQTTTICKYGRIFLEYWSEWRKPVSTRDITLKSIKERLTYLSTEKL